MSSATDSVDKPDLEEPNSESANLDDSEVSSKSNEQTVTDNNPEIEAEKADDKNNGSSESKVDGSASGSGTTELNNVPSEESANGNENKNNDPLDDDDGGEDDDDGEEDEEDDNIKVTIEDYDFKATIQKQTQPAKQAAPLVLETNQEPIDINQLDEKPWRKPGADINDYFNYGFDETTWRLYCDKQNQMRQIVNEIIEPQETFKIPVVHAAPMVQQNVMPYIDERLTHVVMDSRNAALAQTVPMQLHHQHPHQHHNQSHHQHQHQPAGGSGRMKGVEDDVKKYDRRHDRSSERRHSSKSRERRHSKSREREREKEKDKDRERKRSRSRERRSKEARSRPRSRSREEERKSKRHKSSRHV